MKKIGERIKKLRLENNKTLDDLATHTGTTRQTIFKYENGTITNIPSDKIEKMANYFNVSPAYLMGWEDEIDSPYYSNELGKFVRNRRGYMPVDIFANAVGLSPETINDIEKGYWEMLDMPLVLSDKDLNAISKATNASFDEVKRLYDSDRNTNLAHLNKKDSNVLPNPEPELIVINRAMKNMSKEKKDRMMKLLKLSFEEEFDKNDD